MVSLHASRFASFEYKNKIFKVDIPSGVTPDQLLEPAYWMHVSRTLQTGDEIVALAEDNTYYVRLIVLNAGINWANVKVLYFAELSKEFEVPADADTAYDIVFGGNFHKWRVVRKSDNQTIAIGMKTREEAVEELKRYKKAIQHKAEKPAEEAA